MYYHTNFSKELISEPINSIGLRTRVSILAESGLTFKRYIGRQCIKQPEPFDYFCLHFLTPPSYNHR